MNKISWRCVKYIAVAMLTAASGCRSTEADRSACPAGAESTQPNIVMFLVDDMG